MLTKCGPMLGSLDHLRSLYFTACVWRKCLLPYRCSFSPLLGWTLVGNATCCRQKWMTVSQFWRIPQPNAYTTSKGSVHLSTQKSLLPLSRRWLTIIMVVTNVVSYLLLEPDHWKNQKEGLGDRLGWKCTVHPECWCTSNCFIVAFTCAFNGTTNCNTLKETENRGFCSWEKLLDHNWVLIRPTDG